MRNYIPPNFKAIPEAATKVFTGEIFDVYQWPQKLYDGRTTTFEMLKRADTVNVIAVKDDKIVVERQRQPHEDWFYSFPGGRNDHGEDELTAAKREMLEETGMEFKAWRLVEAHQPYKKIDWVSYTFLATDFLSRKPQSLDGGEEIEVREVGFDEFLKLAKSGEARYMGLEELGEIKSIDDLLKLPELK